MSFTRIDMATWKRRELFKHFTEVAPCSFSMTANLDITRFRERQKTRGLKLYPMLICLIAGAVNLMPEFRTAYRESGELVIHDVLHPLYTIFNKDTELFSAIWTGFDDDVNAMYEAILNDMEQYGNAGQYCPKPDPPENLLNISAIPWTSFSGFNLNLFRGENYLLPIFTIGKFFEQDSTIQLPLAVQAHHAVCDAYHVSRLLDRLQGLLNQ
ncbi:type A chloramphenicol O-acetyltransferase [Desulfovibrio sp. Huiquan2017]|uniref:type A chloramphenicol O-acetyltransferase n=1 Tax=Desulfovibrio sp. Huiquan2017 TaxID=2816861 RepID=UPI001A911884|nr:type A chloramphenicol O-acetyltransferase [Desulfovibrio sp. Huiquan2017]